jgi:hypothetical protein
MNGTLWSKLGAARSVEFVIGRQFLMAEELEKNPYPVDPNRPQGGTLDK